MTLKEFQEYVIKEAKKLYQIEILKEEKLKIEKELSILSECVPPAEIGHDYLAGAPLMDPETLKKVRQEMLKKAAGWTIPEPKKQLDEEKGKAVNPWAICHASTGPEKDEKFEKCVMAVKAKHKIKKENSSSSWQMYYFKVKHDNGVMRVKTTSTSEEAARKAIANAEGAPESAITFIKSGPLNK